MYSAICPGIFNRIGIMHTDDSNSANAGGGANHSGMGDGSNPGQGSQHSNSGNQGQNNPGGGDDGQGGGFLTMDQLLPPPEVNAQG